MVNLCFLWVIAVAKAGSLTGWNFYSRESPQSLFKSLGGASVISEYNLLGSYTGVADTSEVALVKETDLCKTIMKTSWTFVETVNAEIIFEEILEKVKQDSWLKSNPGFLGASKTLKPATVTLFAKEKALPKDLAKRLSEQSLKAKRGPLQTIETVAHFALEPFKAKTPVFWIMKIEGAKKEADILLKTCTFSSFAYPSLMMFNRTHLGEGEVKLFSFEKNSFSYVSEYDRLDIDISQGLVCTFFHYFSSLIHPSASEMNFGGRPLEAIAKLQKVSIDQLSGDGVKFSFYYKKDDVKPADVHMFFAGFPYTIATNHIFSEAWEEASDDYFPCRIFAIYNRQLLKAMNYNADVDPRQFVCNIIDPKRIDEVGHLVTFSQFDYGEEFNCLLTTPNPVQVTVEFPGAVSMSYIISRLWVGLIQNKELVHFTKDIIKYTFTRTPKGDIQLLVYAGLNENNTKDLLHLKMLLFMTSRETGLTPSFPRLTNAVGQELETTSSFASHHYSMKYTMKWFENRLVASGKTNSKQKKPVVSLVETEKPIEYPVPGPLIFSPEPPASPASPEAPNIIGSNEVLTHAGTAPEVQPTEITSESVPDKVENEDAPQDDSKAENEVREIDLQVMDDTISESASAEILNNFEELQLDFAPLHDLNLLMKGSSSSHDVIGPIFGEVIEEPLTQIIVGPVIGQFIESKVLDEIVLGPIIPSEAPAPSKTEKSCKQKNAEIFGADIVALRAIILDDKIKVVVSELQTVPETVFGPVIASAELVPSKPEKSCKQRIDEIFEEEILAMQESIPDDRIKANVPKVSLQKVAAPRRLINSWNLLRATDSNHVAPLNNRPITAVEQLDHQFAIVVEPSVGGLLSVWKQGDKPMQHKTGKGAELVCVFDSSDQNALVHWKTLVTAFVTHRSRFLQAKISGITLKRFDQAVYQISIWITKETSLEDIATVESELAYLNNKFSLAFPSRLRIVRP